MEKWVSPSKIKGFLLTGAVDKFDGFPQTENLKKFRKFFHSFSFHIPQPLWKKSILILTGSSIYHFVIRYMLRIRYALRGEKDQYHIERVSVYRSVAISNLSSDKYIDIN